MCAFFAFGGTSTRSARILPPRRETSSSSRPCFVTEEEPMCRSAPVFAGKSNGPGAAAATTFPFR